MSSKFVPCLRVVAGLILLAALSAPAVASASNVIYTCGSPGNFACVSPGSTGGGSGSSGTPTPTAGTATGGVALGSGIRYVQFAVSCCPPGGMNGSPYGLIYAIVPSGVFTAVVSATNGTTVKITSRGDDLATMVVTGAGTFGLSKAGSSTMGYTLTASDNGTAPDSVVLTLANGLTLSGSCMNCVEITPTTSS